MNDSQMLELLASTDAYAPDRGLPASTRTRDAVLAEIERRHEMQTQERLDAPTPRPRTIDRWLVLATATAVVVIVGFVALMWASEGEGPIEEPIPTTTVTSSSTTVPPAPVLPIVGSWQRVGAEIMDPVVGLFDMTEFEDGLIAVGYDPGEHDRRQNGVIFRSDDGVVWTRLAEDDPALNVGAILMYAVTEGGPGLVAVGIGCEDDTQGCVPWATSWTSTDGTTWERSAYDPAVFGDADTVTTGMSDVIALADGSLIAVGALDEWVHDDDGVAQSVTTYPIAWRSSDGLNWERTWVGQGFELTADEWANLHTPPMESVAQSPSGDFVAVGKTHEAGGSIAAAWTSADGVTWQRAATGAMGFEPGTVMVDVTWGGHGFVAVGIANETEAAAWRSLDGTSWTRVGPATEVFGSTPSVESIAALDSGYIAAGPGFAGAGATVTLFTSPDGEVWDRVAHLDNGVAVGIVVVDNGIAVAGSMPYDNDVHAAVWAGPTFDPESPPQQLVTAESLLPQSTETAPDEASAAGGVPIGDDKPPPSEGEYAEMETTTTRLPLGEVTEIPDSIRFDFRTGACEGTTCQREATFIHPDDQNLGTSYWIENTPFHVRHGFVNETGAPLGDDFDVVLFVTLRGGPPDTSGPFELDQPYRFESDYVLQGVSEKCGPGYWEQSDSATCEWFVHEFPDGVPGGRYDFTAVWYAPCSAWLDLGFVDSCANPDEVTWEFYGSVNSPIFGADYTEGWFPGPYEPETLLLDPSNGEYWGPVVRGWPQTGG